MHASGPGLVVVDRDGVINVDSDEYIKSPDEWHALPGSLEALAALAGAGTRVVVATNQSGIGRGLFTEAELAAIHARMHAAVAAHGGRISGVYHCPHTPADDCACRKPRPGLLLRIADDLGCDLAGVPVIGDRASDLAAAEAVGARPVLVLTGAGRATLAERGAGSVEHYEDLAAAVAALIRQER